MTSIRKAKKIAKKSGVAFKSPDADRKKLLRDTREIITKVNKRLRSLEKGDNYNSYASKKLFNRLDSKTLDVLNKARKGGKVLNVKINKNLNKTQLIAVQKASKQFLVSATSTNRGILDVQEKTKNAMYQTLKIKGNRDITRKEIEEYYDMLGDKDFDYFNDKFGASEVWNHIEDAKEYNDTVDKFIERLGFYKDSVDEDLRERATRLYNKYVL